MKILMAGGGSGGHVYPGVSIARAMQSQDPNIEIEFVGTSQGAESKIIPREGFPLHIVEVGRLNNNVDWSERFWTIVLMPWSLIKAALLVIRLKPDFVLGLGGFASGPALLMAALMGKKTAIWEPNAHPGLANRILSRFVSFAIVVFEESKALMKAKKYYQMPLPVRDEIEKAPPRVPVTADFCVLVFGGSQGARGINNAVLAAVEKGGLWLSGVRIVHQTGSLDFERISSSYKAAEAAHGHVECIEYIHDMPARYNWADLVLCRAGTGTLSELAALGKASILVPLPTAADDHQRKNAEVLAEAGAARLLLQSDMTPDSLIDLITELKKSSDGIEKMESAVKQFYQPGSAMNIAKLLMEQAEKS